MHNEELQNALNNASRYSFVVKFTRDFADDLPVIADNFPGIPIRKALMLQLRNELQHAFDEGMAGEFKIIDGPVVEIK